MTHPHEISPIAGVTLTVEFAASAVGGAAVTGRVVDERGQTVPFTGWIGLLEVLEAFAAPVSSHRASP